MMTWPPSSAARKSKKANRSSAPVSGSDLVCEKVYFDNATVLRQLGVGV